MTRRNADPTQKENITEKKTDRVVNNRMGIVALSPSLIWTVMKIMTRLPNPQKRPIMVAEFQAY